MHLLLNQCLKSDVSILVLVDLAREFLYFYCSSIIFLVSILVLVDLAREFEPSGMVILEL